MRCKFWIIASLLLFGLGSCKKEAKPETTSQLLVGKWYFTNLVSVLSRNGVVLDTSRRTNFTNTDFVEYYTDGSGYYSKSTSQGTSLTEFNYSISGNTITQFSNAVSKGQPETIKTINSNSLAIHAVSLVPDPNDPTLTDTEVDDYTFSRQL